MCTRGGQEWLKSCARTMYTAPGPNSSKNKKLVGRIMLLLCFSVTLRSLTYDFLNSKVLEWRKSKQGQCWKGEGDSDISPGPKWRHTENCKWNWWQRQRKLHSFAPRLPDASWVWHPRNHSSVWRVKKPFHHGQEFGWRVVESCGQTSLRCSGTILQQHRSQASNNRQQGTPGTKVQGPSGPYRDFARYYCT